MKTIIRELLSDMLNYISDERGRLKYLGGIDVDSEANQYYHQIRDLVEWLDLRMIKTLKLDPKKLSLIKENSVNPQRYVDRMISLFKKCPELNELFRLDDEYVYFNLSVSEREQNAIRQFIDENRERKVTNFYIPVKERKK
ncbi:hypothetical protein SAMN04489761_2803 [Tenacibaculum sp. MAR_2009_124]|uniref:hypothetical protein n=1 Tax=Tenacibaculum sp. MAR_2009_124 TaxID=1250059 RepID=UPI000897E95F|nr:hypothetical protein [Tenacibaculum sp. MAR_2009_124]SEC37066.1 hypothetical protein SAMN04489761_2803 [Tenacibaculum sp. MAR_2009_124]